MNLGFFWSKKWPFSWRITSFQKKIAWNPYFYSVFGCAFSGPRCQKKAIFWIPCQKKKKILTDNWKALFLVFLCFLLFLSWFFFFCCFLLFFCFVYFVFVFVLFLFGGFKGQVRWPKGPPHLALNPPYFFVFCFFFVFFVLFFFGGFKGQVRWPKGPPHLALNPPYFLFFFFGFCFFSLLCFLCFSIDKKTCFSP